MQHVVVNTVHAHGLDPLISNGMQDLKNKS